MNYKVALYWKVHPIYIYTHSQHSTFEKGCRKLGQTRFICISQWPSKY